MSTCEPHVIAALFFGELSTDEAAALQRHAAQCPRCTRELADLREDRARLSATRGRPPRLFDLYREVERRISAPPERARFAWKRGMKVLSLASSFAVLALLVSMPALVSVSSRPAMATRLTPSLGGPILACRLTPTEPAASLDFGVPLPPEAPRLEACLFTSPEPPVRAAACF